MVFSSIPAYLDPSNWHQQQNHQIIGSSSANPLHPPPPQPAGPHPPLQPHGGPGAGSIRPGSMSERARLANMPMPEAALKCPRCESTNTKFCYFNNYSLTQPRHFCKSCRRYWTRGGALRNVPVGGGCRRNKRSKSSSSSKSPAASGDRQTNNNNNNPSSTSSINPTINSGSAANMLGLAPPQFTPQRFVSPLAQLMTENFGCDHHMRLNNYNGITAPPAGSSHAVVGTNEMNFHGTGNLLRGGSLLSSDGGTNNIEPWRLQQVQQFPFMEGLDQSLYQFQGGESNFMAGGQTSHHQVARPKFPGSMLSQTTSVKMEENPGLTMSRQLLGGLMHGNHEQWNNSNAASWTELSSFSSSSTSNPL